MNTAVLLLSIFCACVSGHGFLQEPPPRNYLWVLGFPEATPDYELNELNCGGFARQWDRNDGQCGVCGDAYDSLTQKYVHDKTFATGIIARIYKEGDEIDVKVNITANHKGYFTFKLGKQTGSYTKHQDLTHNVKVVNEAGLTDRYTIGTENGVYSFKVKLPENFICDHCVFQWTYRCGNNYGCDKDGPCGIGYGKQETFVNCADIEIVKKDEALKAVSKTPVKSTPATTKSTTDVTTGASQSVAKPVKKWQCTADEASVRRHGDIAHSKCNDYCKTNPSSCDLEGCSCSLKATVPKASSTEYIAVGEYSSVENMDEWCTDSCSKGFCPKTHCASKDDFKMVCKAKKCASGIPGADSYCQKNCKVTYCPQGCHCEKKQIEPKCRATGAYKKTVGITTWCNVNCPENCPPSMCECDK